MNAQKMTVTGTVDVSKQLTVNSHQFMNKSGPLVLVEDDLDDQEMILLAFQDLGFTNEIKVFKDAESALQFLYEFPNRPFLIVSDINMPRMDGLRFKEKIESWSILKDKSIPFVFLSTASTANYIKRAYELKAQGFFQKGSSYQQLKSSLNTILTYWLKSMHPN
jgi:CheY-like chemotaxis protein